MRSAAPPQQELRLLQAASREFASERERLTLQIDDFKAQIAQKKDIVKQLEQTVAELRKPDGQREGLPRCSADALKALNGTDDPISWKENQPAKSGKQDAVAAFAKSHIGVQDAREDLELQACVAAAVAEGPNAELKLGWEEEDFAHQFTRESATMEDLYKKFSPEQRLVWEMQNPIQYSLRVDRKLVAELKQAGKQAEAELLTSAAGEPSDREKQYRPLLWLRKHSDLNASFAEPSVLDTSLLTLACQAGFPDVVRELLQRRADVHHKNSSGTSALLAACQSRHWMCAELLLQEGAVPDINIAGPNGEPLVAWAADLSSAQGKAA